MASPPGTYVPRAIRPYQIRTISTPLRILPRAYSLPPFPLQGASPQLPRVSARRLLTKPRKMPFWSYFTASDQWMVGIVRRFMMYTLIQVMGGYTTTHVHTVPSMAMDCLYCPWTWYHSQMIQGGPMRRIPPWNVQTGRNLFHLTPSGHSTHPYHQVLRSRACDITSHVCHLPPADILSAVVPLA